MPPSACSGATASSADLGSGLVAGTERVDNFGIDQVWVPAGTFTMGSIDNAGLEIPSFAVDEFIGEQPAHEVTLSEGFWIDKFEVTVVAYKAFDAAGGYDDPACWSTEGWEWRQERGDRVRETCGADDAQLPRSCVNWYEAEAYATWRGGALPTEAQWEYAARGPESNIFPWGNEWDPSKAHVVDANIVSQVGSFPAGTSWVGAQDMSGNLMEWVADWLDFDYYATTPSQDPTGPEQGEVKVEKGGWWGSVPYVARSAYRHFEDPPEYRDHHIGFRIISY